MKKVLIKQNSLLIPEMIVFLSEGKRVCIKAKGNSMLPFIQGDKDCVVLVKTDEIRLYDIVLATIGNNQYVLHRVIRISGNQLTLMGDGNLKACEFCQIKDVYGTAIEVIHGRKIYLCRNDFEQWKAKLWHWLLPVRGGLLKVYKCLIYLKKES